MSPPKPILFRAGFNIGNVLEVGEIETLLSPISLIFFLGKFLKAGADLINRTIQNRIFLHFLRKIELSRVWFD